MKLVSNITCIFAIIAQIFLSSVAFAHDVSCQSSIRFSITEKISHLDTKQTQSCGCCHSHDASNKVEDLNSNSLGEEFTSEYPPVPCTCSSDPVSSYRAGEYSVETRERKISLIPFASVYDRLPLVILPNFPALNTLLNSNIDTISLKERDWLIHLEESSGRFVSTHLSKFLL